MENKKKILFVCVENAGRSQIAEAFFKKYAPNKLVISAGTNPSEKINPIVVEVMKEKGIELENNKPKLLSNDMIQDSLAVNMGCMDKQFCPALFVNDILDWQIDDPKNKSIEDIREIRDKIETKVKELVEKLNES